MRYWFALMLCLSAALADHEPVEVSGKKLYPSLRTFASKQALIDSYLWSYFTSATNDIAALTTAIYIEDTKTILVLSEPKKQDLIATGKSLLGRTKINTVRMTEIDLGSEIFSVGSDYYPLATVSSEYSSGISTLEREIAQSHRISFAPSVNRAFGLAVVTLKAVLGATVGTDMSERETITCMANPGGKVQLQVSNRMLHFPRAKTRSLEFSVKDKQFLGSEWEGVSSAVADEEHVGALFYEHFKLGKHRCVTNSTYFQDIGARKWLEWSKPYSETE